MIRLVHYSLHVPVPPGPMLDVLRRPGRVWLGEGVVDADDDEHVLALAPAGLLDEPGERVAVHVTLGPVISSDGEVLRRLSFEVPDLVPVTRCDLGARATTGHGVRFRLRGEFRPSPDPAVRDGQYDAVEAIAQPLVQTIVDRVVALAAAGEIVGREPDVAATTAGDGPAGTRVKG